MKNKLPPSDCQIMRRKLITHGTMTMGAGTGFKKTHTEWVDEKCGTPLFGDYKKNGGVCCSCLQGWTSKHNFMLDTKENKRLLKNGHNYTK